MLDALAVLFASQDYFDASEYFTATVAALLWAVYKQAAAAGVQLTSKNCPTVVADSSSK